MSVSMDIQKPEGSTPTAQYDAIVVGAGPYGLSAAAHLKGKGLKVATFGKSMYYWREHMPDAMLLRSYWWATNLSDPQGKYGFEQYFKATGARPVDPLPRELFVDYALWFQKNAIPDLDETYVANVRRDGGRFLVTLEDGRVLQSKTVIMAPGLQYYVYRPSEYEHLPASLVSHAADHCTFTQFEGKEVAVIGGGQSALESASFAYEAGAKNVHLITHHPLRWVPLANEKVPGWIRQIRAPKAGMGSGWLNFLLEKYPYIYQRLPRNTRDHFMDTRHGPAGSHWLKPRLLGKVTIHEAKPVDKVEEVDGRVRITLVDKTIIDVDHVILGTGYRPNIRRLPMVDTSLLDSIETYRGSPILSNWFESNIPGLYFIGFSAARSFGPFYRFVVGVGAAARRVATAASHKVAQVK